MIPIGIITRNRPLHLDATLRSLSDSNIGASPVYVFDDGTDTVSGYVHLHRNSSHWVGPGAEQWPADAPAELVHPNAVQCLRGLVETVRVSEDAVGMWNASCFALNYLATKFPAAGGFVLMHDDLLLKPDWFEVLSFWINAKPYKTGIIAGYSVANDEALPCELNEVASVSGQLLYISAEFYGKAFQFFNRQVVQRIGFDVALCEVARLKKYSVELLWPYIARHTGYKSLRRPGLTWPINNASDVPGPFAMAKNVRCFLQ